MQKQMLIDGQWCDAKDGASIEVNNPAINKTFATVPKASTEDVNRAVDAAGREFSHWAARSSFERGDILRKASENVLSRYEDIGRAMTEEQGKPLAEAQGEAKKGAEILRYYAEEGERVYGRIIANRETDTHSEVIYQPIGPCAAISPWNYPVELLAWKVGGALAAGCTMVAKPPSLTPISPIMFFECLQEAGIPAGVINLVTGSGSEVGKSLIQNPKIKKVAFTGSTEVGREVLADCAPQLKKVSLELGGHCPFIVSNQCDLGAAVKAAVRRSFRNMGQICISINRIYVHQDIHDQFVEQFSSAAKQLIIGDGLTKTPCDIGPMANQEGIQKAEQHIAEAIKKGATVVCGGKHPDGEEFAKGNFFEPTILTNVNHDMLVMTEETFGPVVGVMPFADLDEAIRLANDTPYGLATYAFTNNLTETHKLTRELQTGNVAINNPDAGVINSPYGGWDASGWGYEHGPEGLMEYLRAKHLRIRIL